MPFGWSDLLRGNRFWAPVSESALLDAGHAAELCGGLTLIEVSCGHGAAALFLAEEFHLYARGFDDQGNVIEGAREIAGRSPAARRIRFFHGEPSGPVDAVCSLRRPAAASLVRGGGSLLLGRFMRDGEPADPPGGDVVWRREATPLEWERYCAPQERALRAYRRALKQGDEVSPIALAAAQQIDAFRSSRVAYELSVVRVG